MKNMKAFFLLFLLLFCVPNGMGAQLRPLAGGRGVTRGEAVAVLGSFDLQELRHGVVDPGALVTRVIDLVEAGRC